MKKDYLKNNETIDDEISEIKDLSGAISYEKFKSAKKQITIRLKPSTVFYFIQLSESTGIPYQTLINMYLDDCAEKQMKLDVNWK